MLAAAVLCSPQPRRKGCAISLYLLLAAGCVVFAALSVVLVVQGRSALAAAGDGHRHGLMSRLIAVQDDLHRQTHRLTTVMKILTQMGGRAIIKDVLVVAILGLGLLWWRRRWVPVLVLVTSLPAEKFLQSLLGKVVHRGHPPIGLGTYPSGGVARLVAVYGIIWLLVVLRFSQLDRRIALIGWTVLGVAAWVEGFSRFYLLKHWTTDVIGGWIFGLLLLAVLAALADTLSRPAPVDRSEPASPRGQTETVAPR